VLTGCKGALDDSPGYGRPNLKLGGTSHISRAQVMCLPAHHSPDIIHNCFVLRQKPCVYLVSLAGIKYEIIFHILHILVRFWFGRPPDILDEANTKGIN